MGEKKDWNFFIAKSLNELWQIDIKCPFRADEKKNMLS